MTLGLVFLGIHLGNTSWGAKITPVRRPSAGRPTLDIRLWKEEDPLINMSDDGRWLWFDIAEEGKRFLLSSSDRLHPSRQEPHPHPHRPGLAGDPRSRHRR